MLTAAHRVVMALGAVVIAAAMLSLAGPAQAGPPGEAPPGCTWVKVREDKYTLECRTGGEGEEPGKGETGGDPPCDLTQPTYNEFCDGTAACWGNNPAAVENPKELKGVEKPSEDSHAAFKSCRRADGTLYDEWYWTEDSEGPSLAERAQQALAQLALPQFTPTSSPPVATLVNLDTWWWAGGASTGPVQSPPALGVVAIATPARMEVDPGDGAAPLRCGLVTQESDSCAYTYRRGSYRASGRTSDGKPAYPARMRIVYDLRFEFDGDPIEISGVEPSISSNWVDRPVRVHEAQTLVVPR